VILPHQGGSLHSGIHLPKSTKLSGKTTFQAMFVSRKVVFGKPLSKLSCVCLPLEKLVNGKHFPVNRNTFRSTENTFQSKKNLVWFPLKAMFVSRNSLSGKLLSGKLLSKLSCVCLPLGKLVNGKHFPVNEKHFPVNGNTFRSTENTF